MTCDSTLMDIGMQGFNLNSQHIKQQDEKSAPYELYIDVRIYIYYRK